jgi:hypothetical protein
MKIQRPARNPTLQTTAVSMTGIELHALLRAYASTALKAAGIERVTAAQIADAADESLEALQEALSMNDAHNAVNSAGAAKRFIHGLKNDQ